MRFIDLLVALTAVVAVVSAASAEKREVVNADSPFDNKAFHFDPKINKRTPGKRRHHKRSGAKACCGEFDFAVNTDISVNSGSGSGSGSDSGSGRTQSLPGLALQLLPPVPVPAPVPVPVPAPVPAVVVAPPVSAAPPSVNNQDTVVINIDNKINH